MVPAWFGVLVLLQVWSALGLPRDIAQGRIVSGKNATYKEAPYAVSLRYNDCHECGASIIGDRWVLTAAHCIFIDFVNLSTILYGTKNIQNCERVEGHTMQVKAAYINAEYQEYGGYFNDIAVVELEEPLEFNEFVQPVRLPEQDTKPPVFADALLVGWGYPYVDGTVASSLQEVDITIFPDEICTQYFSSNYSTVSHICAGGNGKGQCTGDSGGGLTVDDVQYGIVSWSDKPCATTPGVLTRVSSFRRWIADITGI